MENGESYAVPRQIFVTVPPLLHASATRGVALFYALSGDNECGKTTLIAKLQGMEDPKKGAGLEYYYIDVRDEYRDEQARLNVWVLDGDQSHTGLLKYALTEENFADTLVLLVASMAQPWFIAEALNKWLTVLREHIDKLRIPPEQMREYEQSLVRFYQDYQEPEESQTSSPAPPRGDANPLHPSAPVSDEEKVVLPLSPNTLTQNLGIPIVVVLTKCDAVSTLEKEHDFREEHFDFIQQYIRKFLFEMYPFDMIYGFPFSTSAYVVERDSVFVPSGWDNEKKISILYENMTSVKPDDNFEDTIVKPILRKSVQRDAEVVAEDEQIFLMKQQTQLAKQPAAGQPGEPATPRAARPPTQRTPERAGAAQTSPMRGKVAVEHDSKGAPPGAATEGMLANFFNSLLNKKTGAAVAGKDKAAVTRDAAAELERMTRGKKTVSETNSNDTGASGS
ncbi:hypothetical protein C0Q70_18548 [Pomacea canaliculata]|uniref:Dynein light intermediate chain n=1 Tax=Pomacea canaliculata TaxID=400727 RepID=A0A2T7NGU1_POMCA|nr:hypothetical protein C0Q70_18548 [Pomacea canaliculata]